MLCPSCQAENDDAAEVCFHCRAVLSAVTRGTLIAARYRILAPLGRGGMGAVYRAHDEVLDDEVALKILRPEVAGTPEMARRFRSEIKLARKVSHWNVCRIHEYGEDGGLQYISMELITGGTLKDRLRGGPLPVDQAFDVAVQVAEGLAAIHKVGIIHRDLKSANVMIDADGTAKVMDFGIAKPAAAGTDGASTGYVLGSPEYMSPEQARGRRADFRSDLYSLGVVVFEAFTGRVPFRGATPVATLMMHVEAPPPIDDPALSLPPALVGVLRSALAKDPEARFRDAVSMAAALREARAASGLGPPAAARTGDVHTRRLPIVDRRRRPALAVVIGGIVALAVAAAVLSRRDPAASVPPVSGSPSPAVAMSPIPPAIVETRIPGEAVPVPSVSPTPVVTPSVTRPPILTASVPPPAPTPAHAAPVMASPIATAPPVAASTEAPSPAPRSTPSATAAAAEAALQGWLLVLATPWAAVNVDGRAAGETPLARIPLSPGQHSVVLTHPQYQPFTRRVEVRAGETTTLRMDFADKGLKRR
jgi:hypothetical protein